MVAKKVLGSHILPEVRSNFAYPKLFLSGSIQHFRKMRVDMALHFKKAD